MNNSSYVVLKSLIEKTPDDLKKNLMNLITPNEISKLEQTHPTSKEMTSDLFFTDSLIDSVHYSWFDPILKKFSIEEKKLFISSMNKLNAKNLKVLFKIKDFEIDLSNDGKNFLRDVLFKNLTEKSPDLLPSQYLPDSDLNTLLTLTKTQLVKLINYLSLYDLAKELRQMLETKIIKDIYSYLESDEKTFLKKILKYNEPFSTRRIKIVNQKQKLRNTLHKCGLKRLALALSGQSIDLIWYICHRLDVGRGKVLYNLCTNKKTKGVSDIIESNVLQIVGLIKPQK